MQDAILTDKNQKHTFSHRKKYICLSTYGFTQHQQCPVFAVVLKYEKCKLSFVTIQSMNSEAQKMLSTEFGVFILNSLHFWQLAATS